MHYTNILDHQQPWYSVRSLLYDRQNGLYEERTILVLATSTEDAIAQASKEAQDYAASVEMEYVGYSEAFHLFDPQIGAGTEVYSVMRHSNLSASEYIKRFLAREDEVEPDQDERPEFNAA
jgi:hypothetical protein